MLLRSKWATIYRVYITPFSSIVLISPNGCWASMRIWLGESAFHQSVRKLMFQCILNLPLLFRVNRVDFECRSLKISLDCPCNAICDSFDWVKVLPQCATCDSRICVLYQKLKVVTHLYDGRFTERVQHGLDSCGTSSIRC